MQTITVYEKEQFGLHWFSCMPDVDEPNGVIHIVGQEQYIVPDALDIVPYRNGIRLFYQGRFKVLMTCAATGKPYVICGDENVYFERA